MQRSQHPPRPHFATQSVESTARYVTYCVDAVEALGRLVQDWDGFGVGLIYLTGVNKCGWRWGLGAGQGSTEMMVVQGSCR